MKKLCFLLLLLIQFPLYSQPELTENSRIFLLTCGQGKEIFNTFGHTAIRILDEENDVIFNYGIYDFRTENFVLKFLKGTLPYHLGVGDYKRFLNIYRNEKRSIYQQELNLDFDQRKKIYAFLLENYKPENRAYQYDFFFHNCSTIPKDIFKEQIDGFKFPQEIKDITFRGMLDENLKAHPWSDFGIDLIIGSIADRKTNVDEQSFLPLYLHDLLNQSFIDHVPVVKSEDFVLNFLAEREALESKFRFTPKMFFVLLFIFVLVLSIFNFRNKSFGKLLRIFRSSWFVILGIAGCVLLFMWFGTNHISTKNNWNLLWMHPFYFLLLFRKVRASLIGRVFISTLVIINIFTALLSLGNLLPQQIHFDSIWLMLISVCLLFGYIVSSKNELA